MDSVSSDLCNRQPSTNLSCLVGIFKSGVWSIGLCLFQQFWTFRASRFALEGSTFAPFVAALSLALFSCVS